jgi:hypothetical protein
MKIENHLNFNYSRDIPFYAKISHRKHPVEFNKMVFQ